VYEDGKGWVDTDGDVLEAEPESRRRKRRGPSPLAQDVEQVEMQSVPEASIEAAASEASSQDMYANQNLWSVGEKDMNEPKHENADVEMDANEDNNDYDEDEDDDDDDNDADTVERGSRPDTVANTDNIMTESTPEPSALATPKEVHPLEALYKRPASKQESASKLKPSPINTTFSFFNPDDAAEEEDDQVPGLPPQTPHTKQDMEWRSMRSAAPTPDTAAIGRKFSFPFAQGGGLGEDDDEDEDDESSEEEVDVVESAQAEGGVVAALKQTPVSEEKEESEYRKWFFDHRGDLNRGWKKRRREERKQKRQRENRRLSRRIV